MNRETLFLIITIILSIAGIYYLYRYKKEALWVIACYVVTRAEEDFISGQGKQKLEYAIKEFKKKSRLSILAYIRKIYNFFNRRSSKSTSKDF